MSNKWSSRALSKRFHPDQLDEASLNEKGVILMQGRNVFGDQVYSYLELTVRKAIELKAHLDEGKEFNPSDFGTVVAAGKGQPSEELKAEMAATYHLIDAPTVKKPAPPKAPAAAATSFWGEEENEESSN